MSTRVVLVGFGLAVLSVGALAADRGTPAEAEALVEKAKAHFQEVGRTQALVDFTGKKAPWVDRDLYVVCIDANHTILANGAFPKYVGVSADALTDADGKPLGKAFWNAVAEGPEGSVKYRWINPVSGKIEWKIAYLRRVGDDLLIVGAYFGE